LSSSRPHLVDEVILRALCVLPDADASCVAFGLSEESWQADEQGLDPADRQAHPARPPTTSLVVWLARFAHGSGVPTRSLFIKGRHARRGRVRLRVVRSERERGPCSDARSSAKPTAPRLSRAGFPLRLLRVGARMRERCCGTEFNAPESLEDRLAVGKGIRLQVAEASGARERETIRQ